MRYELSDFEWTAIKPMLPNKTRGVRRANDRRVLNGTSWVRRRGPLARPSGGLWAPARPATIGSCAGGRPRSGTRS